MIYDVMSKLTNCQLKNELDKTLSATLRISGGVLITDSRMSYYCPKHRAQTLIQKVFTLWIFNFATRGFVLTTTVRFA